MKINKIWALVGLLLTLLFQSCGINSNIMLKTPKDYNFKTLNIDSANASKNEYVIHVNDIMQFQFYTNNGQKVLDIVSGGNQQRGQQVTLTNSFKYKIMNDSLVKIPVIGQINLVGLTIRQAEKVLEKEFSEIYVDPFVQISITNKRVIIFPGNGGDAKVVYLQNINTTLLEALALAGGITERGRASKIKLMRETTTGERNVYLIDLSTIDGLKYTDLVVQNGDYIYIEPVPELGKEILKDVAPILSLISSTVGLIFIINKL